MCDYADNKLKIVDRETVFQSIGDELDARVPSTLDIIEEASPADFLILIKRHLDDAFADVIPGAPAGALEAVFSIANVAIAALEKYGVPTIFLNATAPPPSSGTDFNQLDDLLAVLAQRQTQFPEHAIPKFATQRPAGGRL